MSNNGDNKSTNLVVVSGPSGVGKGSLCKLLRSIDSSIKIAVSATTRKPRKGEVDGVDYYFISKDEFIRKIEDDGFIEYSHHFDNYYGTPRSEVISALDSGNDLILEIDVNGGVQVKETLEDAVFIFVLPPSLAELKSRIENRGSEDHDSIMKRLNRAVKELDYLCVYDYSVVNDDIERAAQELKEVIRLGKFAISEKTNSNREKNSKLIEKIKADLLVLNK